MHKVLQIVDTYSWAIGHLAKAIVKHNPEYDWKMVEAHPKAIERGEVDLESIKEDILWADVVCFEYWRTCSQLMALIPELKDKKTILTHQNDKDLLSADWSDLTTIIGRTNYAFNLLKDRYGDRVKLLNIGIDIDSFPYQGKDPEVPVVGYCGRIVPWKGLKEIAKACYELGYPLLVMGKMDKPTYWDEIPEDHRQNMILDYFDCEDDERLEAYQKMTCYVGNSGPGRESGTMPYMEAMAVGVPIITTPSGIAGDIAVDHENCLKVEFNDYEGLKSAIQEMMEFPALREKLRQGGWESVKGLNMERMAYDYGKIINQTFFKESPLISVIIPATFDRASQVREIMTALDQQTYSNLEAIIIWDEVLKDQDLPNHYDVNFPYRHLVTGKEGYNLAMARNLGIIEAKGEYLLFCDSRMKPEKDALEVFLAKAREQDSDTRIFFFGEKGGNKKTFVENFSFIKRSHIIEAGMFNERIDHYGGMSQEIRERLKSQDFCFEYIPEAKATQLLKSSSRSAEKRQEIIKMKNLLYKLGLY